LKMAREGLLMELRVAIDKARKQNAPVRRERLSIKQDGRVAQMTLQVIPMSGPARERNYPVLFERVPPSGAPRAPGSKASSAIARPTRQIENLRQELTATKEFLQSIIEELESANQELQATNEELQSSNEELQSTNEELEAAKEELQHRNAELSQLNNDLNNLFAGVNIPIVMLGSDGRIRRFTAMAAKVLTLIPADLGRPIGDIRPSLDLSDLEQVCRHVIDTATVVEREVRDRDGPLAFDAGPALHDDGQADRRRGDHVGGHQRFQDECRAGHGGPRAGRDDRGQRAGAARGPRLGAARRVGQPLVL
jgi:two-component system CheB/CheR fusion protein